MKFLPMLLTFSLLGADLAVGATWQPDPNNATQVKAGRAIELFRERVPRSRQYFEQASAYVVFPSITRVGFGIGGASGRGIVIAGDTVIAVSRFWQFTSGIQAGARNFSMVVFFKDEAALEYFAAGKTQLMGQAAIAVGPAAVAGTPAYNEGVAVITMSRFGLMGEFSISAAKFSYKPIDSP